MTIRNPLLLSTLAAVKFGYSLLKFREVVAKEIASLKIEYAKQDSVRRVQSEEYK